MYAYLYTPTSAHLSSFYEFCLPFLWSLSILGFLLFLPFYPLPPFSASPPPPLLYIGWRLGWRRLATTL